LNQQKEMDMHNIRNHDGSINGKLASDRFEFLSSQHSAWRQRGLRVLRTHSLGRVHGSFALADQAQGILRQVNRAELELNEFFDCFVTEADLEVGYSWSIV
jgi:hypothetical protein